MLDRNKTLLRRCRHSAAVALSVCLVLPTDSGWLPACQAGEDAVLGENTEIATASDADSDGSMAVVSDANTPARLEPAETAASQPLSQRPLMCCRPSHPATPVRHVDSKVHPTLAALAEAVRPRRASYTDSASSSAAPASARRTQSAPQQSWGIAPKNLPGAEFSQPKPLPSEAVGSPAPIAAPSEPRDAIRAKPKTIKNPWAAPQDDLMPRSIEAPQSTEATRDTEAPRDIEAPKTVEPLTSFATPAYPAGESDAWRSRDPQAVRLARYHRAEAQAAARVSRSPEIEVSPAQERIIEGSLTDENPLRGRDAAPASRTGVWSSASANPLR